MNSHNNPVQQQTKKSTAAQDIASTVSANTIALGIDFALNGGMYGIALAAEANIKKPAIQDLLKLNTWRHGYANTWGVLKYGFYPTFLFEVALSEAGKKVNSESFAKYSEFVMPSIVGMGTAPSVSITAINERFNLHFDLPQVIKQQGISGLKKLSAGATPIGLREGLCYYALHHDTSTLAQKFANSMQYPLISSLFRRENGEPTLFTHGLVTVPDAACVFAGQPLTVLAVNAAITKYHLEHANKIDKFAGTNSGYYQTRLLFWKMVCGNIIEQGKKSGLSTVKSFLPGTWLRTLSLFGTVGVFKTCLEPTKELIQENITHRHDRN